MRLDKVGVTAPVAWIAVLFFFLMTGYSLLLPTYRAPDEPHHLDMIRKVRSGYGYPDLRSTYISQQVMASLPLVNFADHSRNLRAGAAEPRSARQAFSELARDEPSSQPNQMPQHPPLYYTVAAIETTMLSAYAPALRGAAFDVEVGLYRGLNILFAVPLPLIAFATARRLGLPPAASIVAATVPVSIPMLAHIGASVTNDNLLTLLFAVATMCLAGVWRGDGSLRTATVIGVTTTLALLTKAFAFLLLPWVVAGYALGFARTRSAGMIRRGAWAIAVPVASAGWWWARNVVVYGSPLPSRNRPRAAPAGFEPETASWLGDFLEWMAARFWGWFGWVDVRLPWIAVLLATLLVAAALVAALTSRAEGPTRLEVGLLVAPFMALFVLVGWNSYGNYVETGVRDSAIQGRYLFPAVTGLAVACGAGLVRLPRAWRSLGPLLAIGGATVIHAGAARQLLSAFWGSPDSSLSERIDAVTAWAPWPPLIVYLMACGATVALAGAVIEAARGVMSWRSADDSP